MRYETTKIPFPKKCNRSFSVLYDKTACDILPLQDGAHFCLEEFLKYQASNILCFRCYDGHSSKSIRSCGVEKWIRCTFSAHPLRKGSTHELLLSHCLFKTNNGSIDRNDEKCAENFDTIYINESKIIEHHEDILCLFPFCLRFLLTKLSIFAIKIPSNP